MQGWRLSRGHGRGSLTPQPSGTSCSAVTAFSSSSALNLATRQLLSAAGAPEVGPTEDRDHQLLP